jgi:hypothetical protein
MPTFYCLEISKSLADAAVRVCFLGDFGGSISLFVQPETERSCLICSFGVVGL